MAELEKTLSFPAILLISINSIMGTGVFFLPAIAAGHAGNMSIFSWAAMSVIAIIISLFFAELSGMFPSAGGVYEYCKKAFGAFPSFLVGWVTLIVANITIAMLVVGAIRYLNPGLPSFWMIAFSILIIVLFNYMAYRGLQTSASMLIVFAFITLITILSLTIPGLFAFNVSNFRPFYTHDSAAVLFAIFLVAETFFGWETATFLSEETKDAKNVIPKALIISTLCIVGLVMLFVITSLGVLPWNELGLSQAPLSDLASVLYGSSATPIFSILVYVAIIGSVAGWIVSAPRLLMALAKDKMFIEQLAEVHPEHNTPYKAIMFQTVLTSILVWVGAGNYETLLELLVPLVLLMYASVVLAALVMRRTYKYQERTFRVPAIWLLGVIAIGALLFLVVYWALVAPHAHTIMGIGGSLIIVGLPVYVLLKFTYDPEAILSSAKLTGKVSVLMEDFLLPKTIRRHITQLLSLAEQRVLEYGGNVGTLTLTLAEEVGPLGKIFTTELSEQNADIIRNRLEKKGHRHVRVIHDVHHVNRIHPDVRDVDICVSVGHLSYIQDLRKVVRELHDILPENGVILFVDYVDYFKILPNAGWTANVRELKQIFADEGFSITVTKKSGFFWNYLIIHGIKTDRQVPFI